MTRQAGRNATPVLMSCCCALELDPDLLDWQREGLGKVEFQATGDEDAAAAK